VEYSDIIVSISRDIIITAAVVTIIIIVSYQVYYLALPTRTALAQSITDDNGVIMYYYPSLQHSVYNPLILASGGLSYFTDYQDTGNSQSKQYFINTANWLLNNAIDKQQERSDSLSSHKKPR
jgi:hypothetical protein